MRWEKNFSTSNIIKIVNGLEMHFVYKKNLKKFEII